MCKLVALSLSVKACARHHNSSPCAFLSSAHTHTDEHSAALKWLLVVVAVAQSSSGRVHMLAVDTDTEEEDHASLCLRPSQPFAGWPEINQTSFNLALLLFHSLSFPLFLSNLLHIQHRITLAPLHTNHD